MSSFANLSSTTDETVDFDFDSDYLILFRSFLFVAVYGSTPHLCSIPHYTSTRYYLKPVALKDLTEACRYPETSVPLSCIQSP